MRIAEIYKSIQGEGRLTGAASVFVRTSGCNLRCWFCDTPYASWQPEGEDYAVDEVIAEVQEWDAPHVVITGVIDRLEADAEGRPYVVDLKTGRGAPAKDELPRLPQLAAYQVALRAHALTDLIEDPQTDPAVAAALAGLSAPADPGGAALVQLGAGTKATKVQDQPALTAEDTWALEQVFDAARRMRGPAFLTVHDPQGRCALPSVCPLCSEGRQVTEWPR